MSHWVSTNGGEREVMQQSLLKHVKFKLTITVDVLHATSIHPWDLHTLCTQSLWTLYMYVYIAASIHSLKHMQYVIVHSSSLDGSCQVLPRKGCGLSLPPTK